MNDAITVSDPEPVVRTRSVISSSYQQCSQETGGVLGSQLFHLLSGGRIVLVLNTLVYTLCPEGLLCTPLSTWRAPPPVSGLTAQAPPPKGSSLNIPLVELPSFPGVPLKHCVSHL